MNDYTTFDAYIKDFVNCDKEGTGALKQSSITHDKRAIKGDKFIKRFRGVALINFDVEVRNGKVVSKLLDIEAINRRSQLRWSGGMSRRW